MPLQKGDFPEDDNEGILSVDDALNIAYKIIEMADRVKTMHAMCPGAQASWSFTLDDTIFDVTVSVSTERTTI